MVKILLAPDKFRGSLTAREVADAMTEGIRLVRPDADIVALPLADGGEGTARVLTDATRGIWHTVTVSDPLMRPVQAGFGISGDGQTAFIEMAQASGLGLLGYDERNPAQTTTYGTGELIRIALDKGVQQLLLGIGGSATTDAGIGMAAALGWQFLNEHGQELPPTGASLPDIVRLVPPATSLLDNVRVLVACDVVNPLYGLNGAAYIYGPQKGATSPMIELLDRGLHNIASLVQNQFGVNIASVPGAGAAGGLGAGALFFLNATLRAGTEVVLDTVGFDQQLAHTDLVLTGEGKLDQQTLQGKLLKGIADRATAANVPVVAICGTLTLRPDEVQTLGLLAAFSILNRPQMLDKSIRSAFADVRLATFNACRLFLK